MAQYFERSGRRADLSRLLHARLVEHGMTPLEGAARATIDAKVARVAAELGIVGGDRVADLLCLQVQLDEVVEERAGLVAVEPAHPDRVAHQTSWTEPRVSVCCIPIT